jgi:hypothetical protein
MILRIVVPAVVCAVLLVDPPGKRLFMNMNAIALSAVASQPRSERSFWVAIALWCVAMADSTTWIAFIGPHGKAFGLAAGVLSPVTSWLLRPSSSISYVMSMVWCWIVSVQPRMHDFGSAAEMIPPYFVTFACAITVTFLTMQIADVSIPHGVRTMVPFVWILTQMLSHIPQILSLPGSTIQQVVWVSGAVLCLAASQSKQQQQNRERMVSA